MTLPMLPVAAIALSFLGSPALTAQPAPGVAPAPPPRTAAPPPAARPAPPQTRPAAPGDARESARPAPRRADAPPRPGPPPVATARRAAAPPTASTEPTPPVSRWPDRIGPFRLVSKDGRNSLTLGFAGQLQLLVSDKDQGSGAPREQTVKPLIRRVRLTLWGTVATTALGYYLQLSTAPGSLELMDLWLQWAPSPYVALRLGHQKVPFTRHRSGSFKQLTFVDWSLVSPAFGDERQLGLSVHNFDQAPHWLVWGAGLFTGINQRATHAVGVARTFREDVANPSNLIDPGPVDGFHPELLGRVGYRHRQMALDTDTDWQGGPLRFYAGLGGAWDLEADPVRDFASRLAVEALLKVRHMSLAANFYAGWARELSGGRLDQRWAMWGLLAQWSVLVARRYELSARYALVARGKGFLNTARDRADARIAAATDPEEQAALTSQYALAGKVRREHEATLGFNVYIIGRSLKVQADVSWLGTERLTDSRDDVRCRVQLQLTF